MPEDRHCNSIVNDQEKNDAVEVSNNQGVVQ